MILVVETGAGLPNSESYCTVAYADEYHADRGNDAWDNVDNKDAALRKAADYIGQVYGAKFVGSRVTDTQAMDFPRYGVPRMGTSSYYASNVIPLELKKAQAELAFKSTVGELLEDIDPPVTSEQVGSIKVTYAEGATKTKKFPVIDKLLAPFMGGSAGSIRLVRA